MKRLIRYKHKYLRNVKLSELVYLCKTHEKCDNCPFVDYCISLQTHLFGLERYFNRKITIKYIYERKD